MDPRHTALISGGTVRPTLTPEHSMVGVQNELSNALHYIMNYGGIAMFTLTDKEWSRTTSFEKVFSTRTSLLRRVNLLDGGKLRATRNDNARSKNSAWVFYMVNL